MPFISEYVLSDIIPGTFLTIQGTSGLVRGTQLACQSNVSYHKGGGAFFGLSIFSLSLQCLYRDSSGSVLDSNKSWCG